AVIGTAIQRSRARWLQDPCFEKYWVKPSKRKQLAQPDQQPFQNPPRDTMVKLGPCSIVIEPHHFEAMLYTVKGNEPPKQQRQQQQQQQRPVQQPQQHLLLYPLRQCSGPGPLDTFHPYSPPDPAAATPQQGFPGGPPAITPQGSGARNMAGAPGSIAPYSMGHASQPSGGSSHQSPLGLADIRQDMPMSEEPAHVDSAELPSTWNSNYVSPWPLYALDWCKWPNLDGSFGKVAAASYLEDNHNY
ncbi:hypothetical protein KEM56_004990, partial [Ascosphaera pollenicola]